jgi:hypothetical protein
MKQRSAIILGRTLMVLVSICVAYFVAEIAYFRLLLMATPLGRQAALPVTVRVLAQNSKSTLTPHHYIALLGDSYAVGLGDWFKSVDLKTNPEFNSAHLIHHRTGRDVLSFGFSGCGSIKGLATNPFTTLTRLNHSYLFRLPPPEACFVYFYEGNDLDNNVEDIKKRYIKKGYDRAKLYDTDYFDSFIEDIVTQDTRRTVLDRFFLADYITSLIKGKGVSMEEKRRREEEDVIVSCENSSNRIEQAGRYVNIPDGIQGPSLELSKSEIQLSVYVFERSLSYLKKVFPSSRIVVVYIPSPLACYSIVSPSVQIFSYHERQFQFDSSSVRSNSDTICGLIHTSTTNQLCEFVDSRQFIQPVAERELVHGPKDWKHFNRRGYECLSDAVISMMDQD